MKRRLGCLLALVIAGCGQSVANVTPSPTPTPIPSASAGAGPSPSPRAVPDWTEYHRSSARAGVGPTTPTLSGASQVWKVSLDGKVYASPLIVGGRVVVATENDTVYSLDLRTGAVVWQSHLGTPVSAGALPCGDIGPVTGITGTPAADAQAGQLYVVAFLAGLRHVLFTLSLDNGQVIRQQGVDPVGSVPAVQQQRAALSVASGYVYVPLGGLYGDCGNYHGYVVAVPVGGGQTPVYRTPSARESGIWSSMGATISEAGDVFVVTGNGSSSSSFDYSNSVLELSPDLKLKAYFAPSNWRSLDAGDTDLGSVGVALIPALGVLVSIGKEGVAYLLRESSLGGVGGQIAARQVCSGAWGGSAWVGTKVYVPCADALTALTVSGTDLSVAWRAPEVLTGSPIIAAGAVWAINTGSATLVALDPDSGRVLYQLALGAAQHFSTPAATQGYVVVPAGSAVVAVSVAAAA